ncbi:MAG TPA: ACT domain-containing protein, partial [Allocoleopsis sp.]
MVNLTPNPSYSVTIRLQLPNKAGMLAPVIQAIAAAGGNIGQIDLIEQNRKTLTRDITVAASSTEHADSIVEAVKALNESTAIKVLNTFDRTFRLHKGGKISVQAKIPLKSQDDLAMAYTPGVGRVCMAIANNPQDVYAYT